MPRTPHDEVFSITFDHPPQVATYPRGTSFGPRIGRDFEWVWMISGDATWHVDGRDLPLPHDTIALCRPGMRDGFTWDRQRRTRHGYLHFTMTGRPPGLPPLEQWPLVQRLPDHDLLRPLFAHLHHATTDPVHATLVLELALRAFVTGRLDAGSGADDPLPPPLEGMLAAIAEAWSDDVCHPLTLGDLTRAAGCSRVHLCRLCQREFGLAPMEALRHLRLHRVAEQLARTSDPIITIAQRNGFPNPFHLSRSFKTVYGAAPVHFRARMLAGEGLPVPPLVRLRRCAAILNREPATSDTPHPSRPRPRR